MNYLIVLDLLFVINGRRNSKVDSTSAQQALSDILSETKLKFFLGFEPNHLGYGVIPTVLLQRTIC